MQRASQMARPSSSVSEMRQTWMVRPTRTGVASAVRWPSRTERRWLALSSIPTTLRPGSAASAAPKLAADSASRAETPPWRIP